MEGMTRGKQGQTYTKEKTQQGEEGDQKAFFEDTVEWLTSEGVEREEVRTDLPFGDPGVPIGCNVFRISGMERRPRRFCY